MNRHLFVISSLLLITLALGSCGSKDQDAGQSGAQAQPAVNTEPKSSAIQFAAQDIQGSNQSSSQWIGQVPVVINFWGTWCPPCRREIPDLVKLYEEYHPSGVEMIGLAVKDDAGDVSSYAMNAGMKWVMLMANDEVINAYNVVNGIPTTVFLDKDGREVTRFIGSRTYEDFRPAFEAILQGYQQ